MGHNDVLTPTQFPAPGKSITREQITDITPVLFLTDMAYLNPGHILTWLKVFPVVHVAAPEGVSGSVPEEVVWHSYGKEEYRSEVWNRVLEMVDTPWVLFLEDNETIHLPSLPADDTLDPQNWKAALIQWRSENQLRQCYQIRLVAKSGTPLFNGKNLPDCNSYISGKGIDVDLNPVYIYRDSDPFSDLDPEDELSVARPSPQVFLALGARYFDERKYVLASAQYRRVNKSDDVLHYDRLAAINGLASCMAEQYKWAQAVEMAVMSLKLEEKQRLPYLILFRIHQLAKRWNEAHDILNQYHQLGETISAANFDKLLSEEETLVQLAETAFRAGLRKESYNHYQRLYMLRGEKVDASLLQRLLLFSIEQDDYEQSVRFFNELFTGLIPDNIDANAEEQLFEYLALFMEKGWYEFASNLYQELLEHQPGNETYMRRWLVALSKSKDIRKAQQVVGKMRWKKKTG